MSRTVSRSAAAIPKWSASPRYAVTGGGGVSNGVEGLARKFLSERSGFYHRVIRVVELRGGLRKCRTWSGEEISAGRGYLVVDWYRQWPVGGGFRGRGGKPAQRGWSVGCSFGGHGGDRWKESGRQVVASVGTAKTEAKQLGGNEYCRTRVGGGL